MYTTKKLHKAKWFQFVSFIFAFGFIQIFDLLNWDVFSFVLKNIFLIAFLFYNIRSYKKNNPSSWLLNPAVLASILTFLLGYCITNFVYFIPGSEDEKLMYRLLGSEYLTAFNHSMNAVIIAAIAMWIGYNTNFGINLYKFILRFPINFKKFFRASFIPELSTVYVIFIAAILARLYAINLGIYGFAQSPEKLSASVGIAFILISFTELTSLCLLVVSFSYFKNPKNFNYKFTFFLILFVEVGFGIIKGSKSAVVMPFVLSFITYYIVNQKINKSFIIAIFLFLSIAYVIIEPYRQIRTRDLNFRSSPGYIVDTMIDAYFLNKQRQVVYGTEIPFTSMLSRNAYLLAASKSIQYSNIHGLSENDPDFTEKIYTIPLQAFIPRIIWKSKPVEDAGNWFSINVWGSTPNSSVAITPIGFLYFAGGYLFIVLGFFLIGILQKTLWQFYLAGGGQLLVFLAMLSTVVLIDSSYNGMIIYWIRFIPVFIFIQSLILRKPDRSWYPQAVYTTNQ